MQTTAHSTAPPENGKGFGRWSWQYTLYYFLYNYLLPQEWMKGSFPFPPIPSHPSPGDVMGQLETFDFPKKNAHP